MGNELPVILWVDTDCCRSTARVQARGAHESALPHPPHLAYCAASVDIHICNIAKAFALAPELLI